MNKRLCMHMCELSVEVCSLMHATMNDYVCFSTFWRPVQCSMMTVQIFCLLNCFGSIVNTTPNLKNESNFIIANYYFSQLYCTYPETSLMTAYYTISLLNVHNQKSMLYYFICPCLMFCSRYLVSSFWYILKYTLLISFIAHKHCNAFSSLSSSL